VIKRTKFLVHVDSIYFLTKGVRVMVFNTTFNNISVIS